MSKEKISFKKKVGTAAVAGLALAGAAVGIEAYQHNQEQTVAEKALTSIKKAHTSDSDYLAKQIDGGKSVRFFNGSLVKETPDGTIDFPDVVVSYKAKGAADEQDISTYKYYTVEFKHGKADVEEITDVSGMELKGSQFANDPVTVEAVLTQDPTRANGAVVDHYVGPGVTTKAAILPVGTEVFLQRGK